MGTMTGLGSVRKLQWKWTIGLLLTTACTASPTVNEPPRTIQIQQTWQLQPGDEVGGHRVVAGLGDISIDLNGGTVYAPFDGRVQPTTANCILYSSPEVPAYLFRLCGLDQPKIGGIAEGETIGSGKYLHFATLRRQPDGTWTLVEPAKNILQRILK